MNDPLPFWWLRGGLFCGIVCCAGPLVCPAAGPPSIESVRIGFAGQSKAGHWTPVSVAIQGGQKGQTAQVELVAPDGDGVAAQFDGEPIVLTGEETHFLGYVKFGRVRGTLFVRLRGEGELLDDGEFPYEALPSTAELYVTLGDSIGLDRVFGAAAGLTRATPRVTRAADLPDRWLGYEGVTCVVVSTSRKPFIEALTDAQIQALEDYALIGGRLVISGGAGGEEIFGRQGPLRRFLPGTLEGEAELRETSGLESFAQGDSNQAARPVPSRSGRPDIPMLLLGEPRGEVLGAQEVGLTRWPLVIRRRMALGELHFIAVNLDAEPVSAWPDRARFVSRIVDAGNGRQQESTTPRRSLATTGYRDIAGHLRAALDQFQQVQLINFWWIAGLIVLYLLLIGPVDYFFHRRVTRRMALTWLTFPLVVAAFCAIAVLLFGVRMGAQAQLRRVEVVDIDSETGVVRGTTWAHLYSPSIARVQVELVPDDSLWGGAAPAGGDAASAGAVLSWQGLPGSGLGGMSSVSAGNALADRSYLISPGEDGESPAAAIESLPIPTAGSKSLIGRWWRRSNPATFEGGTRLSEKGRSGRLEGTLVNPLPRRLSSCVLMNRNWVYRLDRPLEPGEEAALDEFSGPIHIRLYLSRRETARGEEDEEQPLPPASRFVESLEVDWIVENMMFHGSAGGEGSSVEETHQYQDFLDLTGQLEKGHAVFVGRSDEPAAEIRWEGASPQEKRWTWFRVVYPVQTERQ